MLYKGGDLSMIEVKVMDSHNFEKAMRIFKKSMSKRRFYDGIEGKKVLRKTI